MTPREARKRIAALTSEINEHDYRLFFHDTDGRKLIESFVRAGVVTV